MTKLGRDWPGQQRTHVPAPSIWVLALGTLEYLILTLPILVHVVFSQFFAGLIILPRDDDLVVWLGVNIQSLSTEGPCYDLLDVLMQFKGLSDPGNMKASRPHK
jgi:hypothetical protein